MSAPADLRERERAVVEAERNVVVVAGAGSGKTSVLVERGLHAILARGVEPSRIAAVTFTEAAAVEMRQRWTEALAAVAARAGVSSGAAPEAHDEAARALARCVAEGVPAAAVRERALGALRLLDASVVTTIHGFCTGLLQRAGLDAGLAPRLRVDDGRALRRVVRERWPALLADLSAGEASGALEAALRWFSLGDLQGLFEDLLAPAVPLDAWRREGLPPEAGGGLFAPWIAADAARVADALARVEAGRTRKGKATKFQDALQEAGARAAILLAEGPAALRRASPHALGGDKPPKGAPEDAAELYGRMRRVLNLAIEIDEEPLRSAVTFLLEPAARVREEMRRGGWIGFDGLLVAARDALRERPDLRRREGERLQAILLDEFQDTDPLQYEIFFFLAEEPSGTPARDAWEARLRPGTLFVVGDPKQSIYRFRRADLAAYGRAVDRIVADGGVELPLRASFRSPESVLEPIHRIFDGWLDARSEEEQRVRAAAPYARIESARPSGDPRFGETPRVEVWSMDGHGSAEERRAREARWIACDVACAIRERGLRASDHAVLLRGFSDVGTYGRELQRAGVPYLLQGGRTFYERAEVSDLQSVLRVLVEPEDGLALVAVLRSSVGAVPDAELLAHVEAGGTWSIDAEADARRTPRIARAFAWLRALRDESAARAAEDVVALVLERTRLLEVHAAGFDGAQRVANLRKLGALAASLARERALSLAEIASELDRAALRDPDEAEGSIADSDVDAVRILTIHKAKGLQFPAVYVADLARTESGRSSGVEVRFEEREPARGLVARVEGSRRRTALSAIADLEQDLHEAAEARRLLYVATTRARERLVLLSGHDRGRRRAEWVARLERAFGFEAQAPPEDGARLAEGGVLHRLEPPEPRAPEAPAPPSRDVLAAARRFERLAERARGAARPPLVAPTGIREARETREAEAAEEETPSRRAAPADRGRSIAVGTAVHAILEIADLASPGPVADGAACARICRSAAEEEGADPEEVEREVGAILAAFEAGSLRRRIARARVVARELPLVASGEEAGAPAVAGFADLVLEEEGVLVVADWKTDAVASDAEIAAAVERHRAQVGWYARALGRATGRAVRGEVFFLRADRAVRLE